VDEQPDDANLLFSRTTGSTTSERHPMLAALGGISLIFGVLATALWLVIVGITRAQFSWWAFAPVAVGLLLFVVTALVARRIDRSRR
jgi:VIT1/CCC1 family predicted Fe2+/Mn2+ transporter